MTGHEPALLRAAGSDAADEMARLRRRMPTSVRDSLTWLAHLLDASLPLRVAEDDDEFAQRHLGVSAGGLVTLHEDLSAFTAPQVARALAADLGEHLPVETAGLCSDESPTWQRLRLDGEMETVPSAIVAGFAAGSLLEAPAVVSFDTRYRYKSLKLYVHATDAGVAENYLGGLLRRAREEHNHLRGRCLQVSSSSDGLQVEHVPTPTSTRRDLVVPDGVWAEVDGNVGALFERRALLEGLGLGSNRGVMLVGPPGTGKSALCRVLAAELAGDVTVVLCAASAVANSLTEVYDELAHLAPALVLIEDIDLLVGRRNGGSDRSLHSFLSALDGAMSRHQGVVTVATTNDVRALDDAATRAARFDRIVEVPLPTGHLRAEILRRYLGRLADRVDVLTLIAATAGASGADLRELVRRSVLLEGEDLTTATVTQLIRTGAWAPADTGMYL